MPFGILESSKGGAVPGTAFMNDQEDLPVEHLARSHNQLKHGTGRYAAVILNPQPSDDPNDPLNWPQAQKEIVLLTIGFAAGVAGSYGPMLSAGFVQISQELGITIQQLGQATGWMILTIGLSLFFLSPLTKFYGKRPVYVFSIAVLFVSSIVGGAAKDFPDFQASRVIGGLGLAPFEILVQCTIGDMYFVHERATRIAFWNLTLLCGINLGALIAGYVIQNLGWNWCFWICAILYGVLLVLILLLVPETSYLRPTTSLNDDESPAKQSYWRSLRIYTGLYSNASALRVCTRPLVLLFCPAVFVLFAIYGVMITWSVVYSNVIGVIFVAPPYNFSVSTAGLTTISPLVLSIIGEVVSGPLNDAICLYLTRHNHGIYEPEFRLVLMSVVAVLGAAGFFGFGATVHFHTHWAGPVLTYGLSNMALAFASTCLFGYVLDCYPTVSAEALVVLNLRNFLAFGMSYVIEDWLLYSGALHVFEVLGSVFLATCALTIPLWVFGKKARAWIGSNAWWARFMEDQ